MAAPLRTSKPLLGIDLGGTKILAGIVGPTGRILATAKKKTRAKQGPARVIARIVEAAHEAMEDAGLKPASLGGVGIGAPGQIDFAKGVIVYAPNLQWRNIALRARLEKRLGLPTVVENDVNAVAVAEHTWGGGKGASSLVAISVGTGIGSGIILDGQLWHGFKGSAGEIGHCVIDQDGPEWPASNRGCLEALAGRPVITKRLAKAIDKGADTVLEKLWDGEGEIRSKHLAAAVQAKDKLVISELRSAARIIGLAVGNVINLLNPEVFVLGGGVIEAVGDVMMPVIDKTARSIAIANSADGVKILRSKLGDDAGILGAAAVARLRN